MTTKGLTGKEIETFCNSYANVLRGDRIAKLLI